MSLAEQIDTSYRQRSGKSRKILKRVKARGERRKAKLDPESAATYRKFSGYET